MPNLFFIGSAVLVTERRNDLRGNRAVPRTRKYLIKVELRKPEACASFDAQSEFNLTV